MVKVFSDSHGPRDNVGKTENGSVGVKNRSVGRKDLKNDTQPVKSELPSANLALVGEVRALLKEEYEQRDEAEKIYSKIHYDELMDPDSPNACWRYILHCEQDVAAAFELIKATLVWRKANRVDTMKAEDLFKDLWLLASIGFTGRSRSGNDVVYAIGKNCRKAEPSLYQTVRDFTVFQMLSWDRKHRHDLAQIELVFDMSSSGIGNIDIDFAFWMVSIRDFLPARVKAIYLVGAPLLIRPIIKMIVSWLPARYSRLMKCGTYDELIRPNIDEECIPEEAGGKSDSEWHLGPLEAKWAHELDPELVKRVERVKASYKPSREFIEKIYKMQEDYEKSASKSPK